jgi:putative methionine-R-sulfoxide reductase with GAF domain
MNNQLTPLPEDPGQPKSIFQKLTNRQPDTQPLGKKGAGPSRVAWRSSVRTRLILATLLITNLVIVVMAIFMFYRSQQSSSFLAGQLDTSVRQQADTTLENTSSDQVKTLDNFFVSLRQDITTFGNTAGSMLSQKSRLASNTYWNATQSLSRLPNGSWDNPNTEPVAVFLPASVEPSESLVTELNTLAQLDFSAPGILQANPDTVAIYYGGLTGETFYYPNVDLANLVPPDFDVTGRPWFVAANPTNNPEKAAVWSDPYLDAAANGLVFTVSIPVHDNTGKFHGVVAMDIQLNRITEIVSNIKVAETGHAFLLDKGKRLIAMPAISYQDFGITPEAYPLGNALDQAGQISPDLWEIVEKMSAGENGLETILINGVENYVIYSPIPEVGYSLAIVVPTREMLTGTLAAQEQITKDQRDTILYGSVVVGSLLILTLLATLFLSNRLSRPLIALTSTAEELARGNLNAEATVQGRDEIGVLAATFNNMAGQLRDLVGSLEQRVASRTKALTTSMEVSRRLATVTSTRQLATEVVEQVKAAFDYYHAHIYFFDEAGENLVMTGGTGEAGATMLARGHKLPRGRGLVGRAAETNSPVLVPDVTQEVGWLPNPLLPETRAEVAIPISVGTNVFGVLDVQQNVVNGLGEDDVRLLESLAAQTAVSYQNARVFEESRSKAELETLVNTIGQKIQRTANMEETLQTAIRELGQALGATRVTANINRPEDGNEEPGSD